MAYDGYVKSNRFQRLRMEILLEYFSDKKAK